MTEFEKRRNLQFHSLERLFSPIREFIHKLTTGKPAGLIWVHEEPWLTLSQSAACKLQTKGLKVRRRRRRRMNKKSNNYREILEKERVDWAKEEKSMQSSSTPAASWGAGAKNRRKVTNQGHKPQSRGYLLFEPRGASRQ